MHIENELLSWSHRGIFPGPHENDEKFFRRVTKSPSTFVSKDALEITHRLFDAVPDWVEVHKNEKGLCFWEGAATWIEESKEGNKKALIQIKPSGGWGLYSSKELLSHELVHAMRLEFDESRFEEILAYRTSGNSFRRYFGPLFTNPIESKVFISLLLFSWVILSMEMIFETEWFGQWLIWGSILVLGSMLARLVRSQFLFSKSLANLKRAIVKPEKALAVALRLSDWEIVHFAKWTSQEITSYALKQQAKDLRWKQIFSVYFSKTRVS